MTDTELGRPPEWATWTRRTWVTIWVSVALVVLLVAGLGVRARLNALDGKYGPVTSGSTFGGVSDGIVDIGDRERLVTTGNRTAHAFSSMANGGSHSVVVTSIDHDDITVGARWARYPPDDGKPFAPAPVFHWRNFPVTLEPYEEVRLRYDIRRPPHCQDEPMDPAGGQVYSDSHVVHWESLLGDHTNVMGSSSRFPGGEIQVC